MTNSERKGDGPNPPSTAPKEPGCVEYVLLLLVYAAVIVVGILVLSQLKTMATEFSSDFSGDIDYITSGQVIEDVAAIVEYAKNLHSDQTPTPTTTTLSLIPPGTPSDLQQQTDTPTEAAKEWINALFTLDGIKLAERTCTEQQANLLNQTLWYSAFVVFGQKYTGQKLEVDTSDLQARSINETSAVAYVRVTGTIRSAVLGVFQEKSIISTFKMVHEAGRWTWCGNGDLALGPDGPLELDQTFTTPDGALSFRYPATWTILDLAEGITILNGERAVAWLQSGAPEPDVFVAVVQSPPMLEATILEDNIPKGNASEIAEAVAGAIVGSGDDEFSLEVDAPIELIIAGRSTVLLYVNLGKSQSDPVIEILILLVDMGNDATSLFLAMAPPGELKQFEPLFLTVAETMEHHGN